MKVLTLYLAMLAAVVVVLAMAGCSALGFWNMSDEWCNTHQEASAARCHGR